MCKTKTIASKKHFFHEIINFFVAPLRVLTSGTFRGPSGDVPVVLHASWELTKFHCLVALNLEDIGQYVYCNCLLTRP